MRPEVFKDIPEQYLDLLNKSAQKIGLSCEEINLALQVLSEAKGFKEKQINLSAKLMKAIINGDFPFIVLAKAQADDIEIKKPLSISLIPDPLQLNIIREGQKVGRALSYRDSVIPNNNNLYLIRDIVRYLNTDLSEFPLGRKDLVNSTVAIARRMDNKKPLGDILVIGYLYKNTFGQIQQGLVKQAP